MAYSSAVAPQTHACDVDDLDYSKVADGFIRCTVCPRSWKLIVSFNGFTKWINSCEVRMPVDHVDWLAGMTPYPAPSEEEVLANRKARLEMLDQKEHERIMQFQDGRGALDWLKRERGAGGKVDAEWVLERFSVQTKEFPFDLRLTITAKPRVLMVILRALRTMKPDVS
jgi:hypothetical protein